MLIKGINRGVLVLVLVAFTISGFGQMKQKVADRLYDELAYFKAVELYQDLARKSTATTYHIRRTAECYRLLGDSKNAELWYAKLVKQSDSQPEDFYYYGQMLKSNEKYKEANVQMEKFYDKTNGKDSRGVAHHESNDYADQFKANADRYEINILNEVNTEDSDFGASFFTNKGEKMLVFASARRNMNMLNKDFQWDGSHFLDIYTASLNEDGSVEKVASFDKEVKSKYHEGPVTFVTYNGKEEMYLTRSNYLDKKQGLSKERHNNLQIYMATRDKGGEWSELKAFHYNNDDYSVGHAAFTADGKIMYFVSDMPKFREGNANKNMGETDIWMCERKADGTWDFPENVKSINTEGREMFPSVGPDGILYFASDGHLGLGGLDLFRAEPKGDEEKTFNKPLNMGYPLNTNYDDFSLIVNDDETEGYFSSNRELGEEVGNDDIYRVKILYPFGPKLFTIKGSVIDEKTGDKIPDATVKIVNSETNEIIKEVLADANGDFELTGIPEGSYKIISEKENFALISPYEFNTDKIEGKELNDVLLKMKKNDCGLVGTITDAEQGFPLDGVKITLLNNTTGEQKEFVTTADGLFKDALLGIPCPGGMIDYTFSFEKEGYFPKEVDFKYRITKPGIVNLNEFMKVNLQKKAGDVRIFCGIDEILYDFNKSNIREDAAKELDKLVQCLKDNPDMRVEIGSHTDCRGKDSYNLKLSDRRAKAARDYVVSKGIDKDRIFGKGYGETELKEVCQSCYDCTEEQHQINRRTEFQLVDKNGKRIGKSTDGVK